MSSVPDRAEGEVAEFRLTTDFERSVAFHLSALANKLSIRSSQRLRRRLDVGLMEWRVLALLGVEGEAPPARVARVAGVDKSVVSRAVNALYRRGLVSVCNAQPGRQTIVRLTEEGRRLHDRGMPGVFQAEELLLHGFSPEEQRVFLELLKRMTANLTRLPP
jgi:DNA-binding MarR family transcriptional regulator